jgi:hypothetical protein
MQPELDTLRDKLIVATEQAIDLRFGVQGVPYGAGPVELHSALVGTQEILSELESLLGSAVRGKALLDRKIASAKMVWQEAFDKGLEKVQRKPSFGEFTSSKEKTSAANLEAFEEARVVKQLEEHVSFANEAVEVIRLHYYGLDKVRQDLRKRLDMSQTDYYS